MEVIGEARKRLSPELLDQHPEVAWRRVAGLRDVLIHDYMGVDLNIVWGVTQRALPDLKRQIQAIFDENDRVWVESALVPILCRTASRSLAAGAGRPGVAA
jgi:uncharacterized protein with HEPN domain